MLARPEQPLWVQIFLTVVPFIIVVMVGGTLLYLVGDLSSEVRRDRARAHTRTKQLLYASPDRTGMEDAVDLASLFPEPTGPVRLQQQRIKGWRTPEDAVRVSRGTEWANPWKVGDLVPLPGYDGCVKVTPELAVELFVAWVTDRGWITQMTEELAGLDLVCWCKIGTPCHADWILETVNKLDMVFHMEDPHDQLQSIAATVHKHLTRSGRPS